MAKKTQESVKTKKVDVEDFVNRLTSRKWFLTMIVCAYFMWQGESAFASLTQVVIAFLAIQGGTDALAKLAEVRITGRPSVNDYSESSEIPVNNPVASNEPVGD